MPCRKMIGVLSARPAGALWLTARPGFGAVRSVVEDGLVVTLATALIGILVGVVSGYVGGLSNLLTMRVTDAFLAFPVIAGVWVIQRAFYGNIYNPFGDPLALTGWEAFLYRARIDPIMLAFILFSWMPYARLMNAQARRVKEMDYVRAAEAMGATSRPSART